ncbi:MAG: 6-phosphogluconolactonase [Burkholderiales bacterium]|nr:6-phosphogluconolactonase [Burkholderiales bacterium]
MSLNLLQFISTPAAAQALAEAVADDLRQALAEQERALLLVSGGRSPLTFFSVLAAQALSWERIDVSLVDERCVVFDHPDSNAGLIARHLLQGPAASACLLPLMTSPIQGEQPWRWAQRSAVAANANPAFAKPAAIVLGLGNDGHTASLFVDAPQWQETVSTPDRYVAVTPALASHARVSLSLSALIAQRQCYVWTNGAAKLNVVKQAKALAADVVAGVARQQAVQDAGPFALLTARPDVTLRVFHSNQE